MEDGIDQHRLPLFPIRGGWGQHRALSGSPRAFPTGLVMRILLGLAILPAQFVHALDHKLAIAAPNAVV